MFGVADSPSASSWLNLAAQPDDMATARPMAKTPGMFINRDSLVERGFVTLDNCVEFLEYSDDSVRFFLDFAAQNPSQQAIFLPKFPTRIRCGAATGSSMQDSVTA